MLLLLKMRFAEEIRDYSELNVPAHGDIKPAELKMAISLINQLSPKKFAFSKYKDTYDAELMKLIKLKAKGGKIPQPRFKIVHNKTRDLMSQLKASLEEKKRKAS
jgi:DNA end-binding protein Ku